MSDNSPLFVSTLELISHTAEIFSQKDPKKYKFIILHLANAIELLLKDHVLDLGISIYKEKEDDKTIGLWECIKKLKEKGEEVPEYPVIQLLINDRNNIQHRFGHPNDVAIFYYIEHSIKFFKRFLKDNYDLDLYDALEPHSLSEHLELLGLTKNDDPLRNINKLANISIQAAVLQAYTVLEQELMEYLSPYYTSTAFSAIPATVVWHNKYLSELLKDLQGKGFLNSASLSQLQGLRRARNEAAHNPENTVPKDEWKNTFDTAIEYLSGLEKAKKSGYRFVPAPKGNTLEESTN